MIDRSIAMYPAGDCPCHCLDTGLRRYLRLFALLLSAIALKMGVHGLWPLLHPVSQRVNLTEYATDHGFLANYHGTRAFHIGIDASVLLDGYSAAQFTKGRFFHHATSDSSLTQLFQFLSQLSNAPVDCTFVYDGDERPESKRGKRVITQEPLLYQKSRKLVEAYGFRAHSAKGDADAELAVMNRRGVIDAVLTKDSDVFPLGAQLILKIVPLECTDTNIIVDIYSATLIQEQLRLTHGGLILYSLLAGNDFDNGVMGFGPASALAVAQYGIGDSLVTEQMAGSPTQRRTYLKANVIKRLRRSSNKRLCNLASKLVDSNFPSQKAFNWFLNAPTSWSDALHAPNTTVWQPQGHNLAKIAKLCMELIGWSAEKTLKEMERKVWRGAIIRILCSKFLAYDPATGSLLAPLRQAALYRVNGCRPFAITNSTTIQSCNPPNLATKMLGDTVRITFDVSELIELTFLRIPSSCRLKQSLSIYIPFAIIAAATRQQNLIPCTTRAGYLNPTPVNTLAAVDDDPSDNEVEITELRSIASHSRVPILDISSIDDVL